MEREERIAAVLDGLQLLWTKLPSGLGRLDTIPQEAHEVIRTIVAEKEALEARIEELEDRVEGLTADLESAVEVAYRRGAMEWVYLNYPAIFTRLAAQEKTRE